MGLPKKGERHPGSGRKPGKPNKDTRELLAICEEHGLNPFEAALKMAIETIDPDKKFEKILKLFPYLYAQRKAVEHSTDPEKGFRIIVEDYSPK